MQKINQKNRIIFMGTPKIAAECLSAILLRSDVEVVAVVTQPDRPVGRKKILTPSEVKVLAQQHNIPVLQAEKVSTLFEQIKSFNCDLIFTCAFGQFVPTNILEFPKYKCVNLHASLLPKLRGGAPIQWAIINQESKTGFTLMYMAKKMDAGNIIKQYELPINPRETYSSLYEKLCTLAREIISKDFDMLFNPQLKSIEQDESKVTFGYNISRDDERIDWKLDADAIDAKIRGLYSNPIAYTTWDNQIIKIHSAQVIESYPDAIPGCIIDISKDGIKVATGNKVLNLKTIQMAGKKPCEIKQLINGKHPFVTGKLFI